MDQSSEEINRAPYVKTLLRKVIMAIGPNYLHDHGHVEKFLCEAHWGIGISRKEMNQLLVFWQKGMLQKHLIKYIPKGFHPNFWLNGNCE